MSPEKEGMAGDYEVESEGIECNMVIRIRFAQDSHWQCDKLSTHLVDGLSGMISQTGQHSPVQCD